jgi:phage anti-repressor protein
LDPDERDSIVMTDAIGRRREMLIISEPGLYNLSKGAWRAPSCLEGRISQYGFVEGRDYVTVVTPNRAGPARIEYHATLSMGKELAMVENNHQGRVIRRCDK